MVVILLNVEYGITYNHLIFTVHFPQHDSNRKYTIDYYGGDLDCAEPYMNENEKKNLKEKLNELFDYPLRDGYDINRIKNIFGEGKRIRV